MGSLPCYIFSLKNEPIFKRNFCDSQLKMVQWGAVNHAFELVGKSKVDFPSNPLCSVTWKCSSHSRHLIYDGDIGNQFRGIKTVRVQRWLKWYGNKSDINTFLKRKSKERLGRWEEGGYLNMYIGMAITYHWKILCEGKCSKITILPQFIEI